MPLTPEQLQALREQVQDRRQQLAAEIRSGTERSRNEQYGALAGATHDRGDESVAALLTDVGQAEVSRDLAELRALEVARMRMDGRTYGICSECNTEIDFARLRANPAAMRCVACQSQFEKTHRGGATPRL